MLKRFKEKAFKVGVKLQCGLMCANNKRGQGLTEYVLILALVVIGVIAILGLLSGRLQALFQKVVDALTISDTPT